jgi:acyl-CoA thioester hydrolase
VNADATDAAKMPDHYKFWVEDHVRYSDLDPAGHCNNAVYNSFFEAARVALLIEVGHPPVGIATLFAVVRQTIDYYHELNLGARLRIGARIAKLGRTSVTFQHGIFDGEACAATAEIVGVVISSETRRPVELPAPMREKLSAYL